MDKYFFSQPRKISSSKTLYVLKTKHLCFEFRNNRCFEIRNINDHINSLSHSPDSTYSEKRLSLCRQSYSSLSFPHGRLAYDSQDDHPYGTRWPEYPKERTKRYHSPYRFIPRTIIRSQIQAIFLDIVFQPIAKHRMRFRIEINDMHRLGLVFITANHVVIQIPLHLIHLRECLHEIFGA